MENLLKEDEMLTADQVVDKYFLDTRCMLIEIGAMLDRYDRAAQRGASADASDHVQVKKIYQALSLLVAEDATADRSERLLRLFTDPD